MEDQHFIESSMDGKPFKAGFHAATLRRTLWREHMGLLPSQPLDASQDDNAQPPDVCMNDIMEGAEYEFVADPLSDQVWDMWTGNATKNTEVYRYLFRADPDNHSMLCALPLPLTLPIPCQLLFMHLCTFVRIVARMGPNPRTQSKPLRTIRTSFRKTTPSKDTCTIVTSP